MEKFWDWLEEMIANTFDFTRTSLDEYKEWVNKLERIKKWTPPE